METSIRDIYAAGDVACMNGRWFGQWSVAGDRPGCRHKCSGRRCCLQSDQRPLYASFYGNKGCCSGDIGASQQDQSGDTYDINQTYDKNQFSYSRLVFRDGVFVGYVLIGNLQRSLISFSH